MYAHRLVALTYLPNPLGLPEVNHKDGVKTNCTVLNLEWTTKKGNTDHKAVMGLAPWGEQHFRAILTERDIRRIRKQIARGIQSTLIAKEYGISPQTVADIKFGRSWSHLDG
ncbi:MAG TPA: HNH endonuclease [Nitrospiraceae bacterium]|nr:HNH endonuclease [Nitrospiraceae bacterium]